VESYAVELYQKVRLACADGMSKPAAAAHFNICRDTVAKALAFSVPPGYRRTPPIKRPKLDGFTEIIEAWLDGDKTVHRKQRHTAKHIFDRLRDGHGFTGGCSRRTGVSTGGARGLASAGSGRLRGCPLPAAR